MKFKLDDVPKSKPVMGVDDLLLGLTHHWSRDRSVFPTEDDRLDLPTIMLFQAYTACRPAELVDGTKSRGGKDPLLVDSDVEDATTSLLDLSHGSVPPNRARTAKVKNVTDGQTSQNEEEDSGSELEFDAVFDQSNDDSSDGTSDTG